MRRAVLAVGALIILLMSCVSTQNVQAAAGIPPASRYKGVVKQAYEAANAYPQIANSLFCYCGCDQQNHHRRLIDCFRDEHAVRCSICQDEMIRAAGYKKQGMSNSAISQAIDKEYSSRYPYGTPSQVLKKYQSLHR